jgi:hypothetical protein
MLTILLPMCLVTPVSAQPSLALMADEDKVLAIEQAALTPRREITRYELIKRVTSETGELVERYEVTSLAKRQ